MARKSDGYAPEVTDDEIVRRLLDTAGATFATEGAVGLPDLLPGETVTG